MVIIIVKFARIIALAVDVGKIQEAQSNEREPLMKESLSASSSAQLPMDLLRSRLP